MSKGTAIGLGVLGAVGLAGGAYLLFGKQLGSVGTTISSALSPCSGTAASGLTATISSSYQAQTLVSGPSPGPSGKQEFPCLWTVAPTTLPTSGYQGGPAVTQPNGQVWMVVATNMAVTGTYNGSPASSLGPWVGIAEYSNGQLVRVYPQRATGGQPSIGSWTGGF